MGNADQLTKLTARTPKKLGQVNLAAEVDEDESTDAPAESASEE